MRGGSQSFLVRGNNGAFYVAKFAKNPQGNRTLINECLARHLLSALDVATPDLAVLRLTDGCAGREQLYFSTDRRQPIANGLHLGSRCPVDPEAVAIFDLLPRSLYSRLGNLDDVGTVFAFDCWVAHADTRQFIYARKRKGTKTLGPKPPAKAMMTVWAIDNGMCFGKNWTLTELVFPSSYPSFEIYSHCNLEETAVNGAKRIQALPASVIQSSHQHIPRDWFSKGDEEALEAMLEMLQERQANLVGAVHERISANERRPKLAS
jgi:hypothetical protein